MSSEIDGLRRQVRVLQVALLAMGAVVVVGATRSDPDVIRTHGVVVLDAQGRERILLGSPTPAVTGRRSELATSSIVFRSAEGKDRVLLGEQPNPVVDGKVHPRISPSWGMLWFNAQGDERGGVSYLDTGRSVVSLDRAKGEGVYMTVNERSGFAGLVANYETAKTGDYAEGLRIGTLGNRSFGQASNRDGSPAGAILAGDAGRARITDVVQK